MNKEELINQLKELDIELTEEQFSQINKFCLFLLSENEKYNLTAIRNYDEVLLKHVYDSLTICLSHDFTHPQKLLDIGSGAGFPGVILKIIFPHLKIKLLDSNGKKTLFLNKVKDLLNIDNLEIVNERAETFIKYQREAYDVVTARAVASLNILMELAIPFLKVKGIFIAMKANISDEIELGKEACEILNSSIIKIHEFKLPIENSNRTLVVIEKQNHTNLQYPRSYDRIIKKPLKKKNK